VVVGRAFSCFTVMSPTRAIMMSVVLATFCCSFFLTRQQTWVVAQARACQAQLQFCFPEKKRERERKRNLVTNSAGFPFHLLVKNMCTWSLDLSDHGVTDQSHCLILECMWCLKAVKSFMFNLEVSSFPLLINKYHDVLQYYGRS